MNIGHIAGGTNAGWRIIKPDGGGRITLPESPTTSAAGSSPVPRRARRRPSRSSTPPATKLRLRRKLYRLKEADPSVRRRVGDRLQGRHRRAHAEARRRAVEGVDEPRMLGHGENAELVTSGTATRCSCS
jgi:hypothetical protein